MGLFIKRRQRMVPE